MCIEENYFEKFVEEDWVKFLNEKLSFPFEEFWNEFDTVDKSVANEIEIDSIKKDDKGKELFPVNLVKDFDQFIDYIQNHTVQLTKTMEYIARKHLPMINERMTVKNNNATSYT